MVQIQPFLIKKLNGVKANNDRAHRRQKRKRFYFEMMMFLNKPIICQQAKNALAFGVLWSAVLFAKTRFEFCPGTLYKSIFKIKQLPKKRHYEYHTFKNVTTD